MGIIPGHQTGPRKVGHYVYPGSFGICSKNTSPGKVSGSKNFQNVQSMMIIEIIQSTHCGAIILSNLAGSDPWRNRFCCHSNIGEEIIPSTGFTIKAALQPGQSSYSFSRSSYFINSCHLFGSHSNATIFRIDSCMLPIKTSHSPWQRPSCTCSGTNKQFPFGD